MNPCFHVLCLALASFTLFFSSCKNTQYTPATYTEEQLIFGSGGGFTGAYVNYYLLSNGQLFRERTLGETELMELEALEKQAAQAYFNRATAAGIETLELSNPGNMTYFIRWKVGDAVKHEIKWGGGEQQPPPAVKSLFDDLISMTRKQYKQNNNQ